MQTYQNSKGVIYSHSCYPRQTTIVDFKNHSLVFEPIGFIQNYVVRIKIILSMNKNDEIL
ncbi:hypothetical protein [Chishuiella sp.]|uniref:hypothetical protein n=1 Tax=Chishuiella sp. TaxID=1969467 RepID=UPI0028A66985|nr:hypothetical protein [Chishuiella sp.]